MSKAAITGLASAMLVVMLAGTTPRAASDGDPVEAAIAAIAVQVEAWNRGDLEAFTAMYAEDCTFVTPNGITRGRSEVLERYRGRYPDRAAMGTLAIDIEDTSALRGTGDRVVAVAIVGRWTLRYPDDPAREDATGWTLIVLERRAGDAWAIVQDASMVDGSRA